MNEHCLVCSTDKVSDLIKLDIDLNKLITWKQWIDEKGTAGIQLKMFNGKVEEAIKELESKMLHFKKHSFVKKVQEQLFY